MTSRASITPGLMNALGRGTSGFVCKGCGLELPKYAGRYPSTCPRCQGRIERRRRVSEDAIPGGKADDADPLDFDQDELAKGVAHEMEHTDDPLLAREIAMDHLAEDPKYYSHLEAAGVDERGRGEGAPVVGVPDFPLGEAVTQKLPSNAASFLDPIAVKKANAFAPSRAPWRLHAPSKGADSFYRALLVPVSGSAADNLTFRVGVDIDDETGENLDWSAELYPDRGSRLYGHVPYFTGYGDTVNDALKDMKRSHFAESVQESAPPVAVVCVSCAPRLQKIIEAGARAPGRRADCSEVRRLTYDQLEALLPSGAAGLALFLEGPVKKHTYYRVEGAADPVLVFEADAAARLLTVHATTAPQHDLGFDPREEFVGGDHIAEADTEVDVFYPQSSLGYERRDLPQIDGALVPGFIEWLKGEGNRVVLVDRPVSSLKATQRELNRDKINALTSKTVAELTEPAIIVARDGHILDGHHRWAALYAIDPSQQIPVYVVDLSIDDLIATGNRFPGAHAKEIDEQLAAEAAPTPASVQSPTPGGGGLKRVHGGFRFRVGANREPVSKNLALSLQAQRNARRGLATRMRAVKKFHRSPQGQRLHKALGQYNRTAAQLGESYVTIGYEAFFRRFLQGTPWDVVRGERDSVIIGQRDESGFWRNNKPRVVGYPDDYGMVVRYELPGKPAFEKTYKVGYIDAARDVRQVLAGGRLSEAAVPAPAPGVTDKTVDQVFDSVLRCLIVIDSLDILLDAEFTEEGAIYLYFDPSLKRAEIDEVVTAIKLQDATVSLVASPDQSLPGEATPADWWVALVQPRLEQAMAQPLATMSTTGPQAGANDGTRQQLVTMAPNATDDILQGIDVDALFASAQGA